MNARKMLCSIFASLSLGAAGAAAAQDVNTAGQQPPAPRVMTNEELDAFDVRSYFLKDENGTVNDRRGDLYLCGDNTQSCWTQAQREAWVVREFQAMMRVSVHTCQQDFPGENLLDRYNDFVTNNQPTLLESFNTVDNFYDVKVRPGVLAGLATNATEEQRERAVQRASLLAFDALDIATGNMYSGAGVSPEYCQKVVPVLRYVSTLQNDADVVRVANRLLAPRPPAA